MIKRIFNSIYYAIIAIILTSFVISGWTFYALISNTSNASDIKIVLVDIYNNQKSFLFDIIDLSKLLIKNSNQDVELDTVISAEEELEYEEPLDTELIDSLAGDDGDNPLGIVILPSEENITNVNKES